MEFIAEGEAFYFMEINTRLQVEHPVTEMITGLDLVEWQSASPRRGVGHQRGSPRLARPCDLRCAFMQKIPRATSPSVGVLTHLRQPRELPGRVRVDAGVSQGDQITPNYDPMIAKLIVWSEDRPAAVRQMAAALAEYEVVGVTTNLGLLRAIAAHPAFAAGELDTGFIARHATDLMAAPPETDESDAAVWAAAALTVINDQRVQQ